MGIKSNIQFYNTILREGFALTGFKSINTHDGACWNVNLAYGKTKIAEAANGGYGGPNELRYIPLKTISRTAQQELLHKFWALPCVTKAVHASLVQELGWEVEFGRLSQAEFEKKRDTILASTPEFNLERVADIIESLTNGLECVKTFKRKQAKKVCVVLKTSNNPNEWTEFNFPDTPENRERVKKHLGDKLDYFIADILDSTQEPNT